jgi:GNAT superfamily N-acetyltransferase
MQKCEVREITAGETIPIRCAILRPGFPPEAAIFEGDDRPDTRHFGCFLDGQLQGVASIYRAPLPGGVPVQEGFQLRGMAVQPEMRGRGCGVALVRACELQARSQGADLLWCNARSKAVEFYRRHGFSTVGEEFDIPTVGPHWRMVLPLKK